MSNILIIQSIIVEWTKASRGGNNAALRNAVPEALRVPFHRVQSPSPTVVYHKLAYSEAAVFASPREDIVVDPDDNPIRIGCVTIDRRGKVVNVLFRHSYSCGGAPERGWARKDIGLSSGEWGQIAYNGRFAYYSGDWYYKKTVVNVGLFEEPGNGVFTAGAPTHHFECMAHLF